MAWLEKKGNTYQILFRFGGQRYKKSLKTKDEKKAEARKIRIEETIQLVEEGRLTLPDAADVAIFILSEGKLEEKPKIIKSPSIAKMNQLYLADLPTGTLEDNTLYTAQIHMQHHEVIFGSGCAFNKITNGKLQGYINKRSRQIGRRGKPISAKTIRQELSTLSCVWNWAKQKGYVANDFPNDNLRFPKLREKPPFQTWKQIETTIARGGLSKHDREELWECLYLTRDEIDAVLDFVQENALYEFIHPMIMTAAHTGARRSELIRSQIEDIDFTTGLFHIRERKRVKGSITMRTIPLSPELKDVLKQWIKKHPGGRFTFCHGQQVVRSCKDRTNHIGLTVNEATHHFNRTLNDSKWEKINGWHVFRHSFISNCACKGVDQRMIDEWVGHTTEAMRRRYRHLFPDSQAASLASVFGKREGSMVVNAM